MENAIHQQTMKNNAYQSTLHINSEEINDLQQRRRNTEKQIEIVEEEVRLLDNLSNETIDWNVFQVRQSIEMNRDVITSKW